jgi:alpha-N-arabinofuranosidase
MDGQGKFAPHLIEEPYNLEDALVVAGFLNSFIRHADGLKIANIAQIVNVIAPILTDGDQMLIQSIYYPLAMYTKRRTGMALHPVVQGPAYEGKTNGQVNVIDTSAILDANRLHVFATNRTMEETATVHIELADQTIVALDSAEILSGPEPKALNSFEQPDLIQARPFRAVSIANGLATATLPPLSVAAMTFQLEQ